MGLLNMAVGVALNAIRDKVINPRIRGIGEVLDISYDGDRRGLILLLSLNGMEDRPIDVEAIDIEIAPDGGTVKVNTFRSSLPFAHNALNRFATSPFPVPDGMARTAVKTAKSVLGL